MAPPKQRASRDEIFAHLGNLLGDEAEGVALQTANLAINGESEAATNLLTEYDKSLGGISLEDFKDKRVLGVYRPIFYVYLPLRTSSEPQEFSRSIAFHAGAYLEELLKRMVRLGFFEKITDKRTPLGELVHRARNQLPETLHYELNWLAQGVHNFAKHEYNFEEAEEQPEHYFELDEALAVYLIVRKLGLGLEALSGKTVEQLML